MTELRRWLDELPEDSPDRDLLAAGRAARPPAGSKDHTWSGLAVALGTAAASTGVATTAQATTSAAATAAASEIHAASAAVGAAATKGLFATAATTVGIKSIAVGFAVGMGLIGVREIAIHETRPVTPPSAMTSTTLASSNRTGRTPPPAPVASIELQAMSNSTNTANVEPDQGLVQQAPIAPIRGVAAKPASSLLTTSPAVPNAPKQDSSTAAPSISNPSGLTTEATPPNRAVSVLAEQAQGLARIQRLLDAGDTAEAIRELELSFSSAQYSSLTEERDALYVQALVRAQRTAQAQLWANRFLQRYPSSPHCERMRRLIDGT